MAELAKHIEVLLLSNDCVIVPEFGGFMAHHATAMYNEEEGLFLPPSRTLGFNPQLKINDSLLVQSYVEAYDISYPEALRLINEEVEEIKQCVENEGECELRNIGILRMNNEGNYDFQPCQAGILSPALYALNSFEFDMLQGVKPVVSAQTSPTIADDVDIFGNDSDKQTDEPKVIKININSLKQYASAAAILLLFILFSAPLGEMNHTRSSLCSVDSSILQKFMPTIETTDCGPEFLKPHQEVAVADTVNNDSAVATTKVEHQDEQSAIDMYVIVLASQVSRTNAEIFINKLHNDGIADARMLEKGSSRKVICGSYTNESAAHSAICTINAEGNYSDAWVLHVTE